MLQSFYNMLRYIFLTGLMLTACDPTPSTTEQEPTNEVISRAAFSVSATLLQIPEPISIPSFSRMKLEGTGLVLEGIESENSAYTRHAISYRSNGLKITGVLLIPKGDGPFPLLILNHGFIDPSVYTRGRGLKREQDRLAREGFAVLHTDYRGHAESDPSPMTAKVYDGNLEYAMDSANAILAMREAKLPTIDTENIGMMGHSLGGGVTMAILTGKPDLVDAAVFYAPVSANVFENFMRWREKREEGDNTKERFGTPETNPAFWNELSPQSYLSKIRAPILLVHGDKDADVPKEWSDRLATELKNAGKQIEYLELVGEGHEYARQWETFMQTVVRHFTAALKA